MLLSERVYAVVPSSASFLGVMCIQNVVVIRDRLKEDYNVKCQTCGNHEKCRTKGFFLSGFSFRNIQKSQSSRRGIQDLFTSSLHLPFASQTLRNLAG